MPVYLDKNTKKYYFKCYYTDWQGEKHQAKRRGFALAREAKAAEREFLAQYATNPNFTFQEIYEKYIADCSVRLRKTSVTQKQSIFTFAILPFFHAMKISEINPVHVRRWQNDILLHYAPTSQKIIHGNLSALFNFAIKFYGLKNNPARIAGSIGTLKAHRAKFWTVEQFNLAMKFTTPATKAAFTLLFYSGLRVGELLALTIQDYNPASRTISVSKSLAIIGSSRYIGPTKNSQSTRIVSIPASVCALLDKLNVAAEKAGLEKIRLHDLRHSHASLLINLGINILAISRRLGHDDIKTTLNIYGHLYHTTNEEIAAKIENLITTNG